MISLDQTASRVAMKVAAQLRVAGVVTQLAFDSRSVKAAMKNADRSGAKFAVLIGEDEISTGTAQLKNLENGEQVSVALDLLINQLSEALNMPITQSNS
jgi:histidyl-tRNA synthetase